GCKGGGLVTGSICEQQCLCEPCTENDLEACKDAAADKRKQADDLGCSEQFGDFVACAEDHISCRDPEAVNTECAAELGALVQCGGSISGDPCKDAEAKLTTCLGTSGSSGAGGGECSGQVECVSNCINAASCDELKAVFNGMQTSGPFLICAAGCAGQGSSSGGSGGG